LALALAPSFAAAAPTAEDRALATELFKQGRELMTNAQYSAACPKLAESHRLDPGGGTVLNLALCYEADGKLASAFAALNDALTMARNDGRDDRVALALEHLAAVEPRMSRVSIVVPAESERPGLTVLRDGSPIARAAWGSAMPVDGGEHRIEVTAPGHEPWATTITVGAERDTQSVTVPVLRALPARPPEPEPSAAPRPVAKPLPMTAAPKAEIDTGSGRTQRVAGLLIGGVGIAAVGVGAYFGVSAVSKQADSERECVNGCTTRGAELSREAGRYADIATVTIALGVAAIGAGGYLVLSAGGADSDPEVSFRVAPGAMLVRGRF
jgi:hypothetical protein